MMRSQPCSPQQTGLPGGARRWLWLILMVTGLFQLGSGAPAAAATTDVAESVAARVIAVRGAATATSREGAVRSLVRRSEVQVGDTLSTGTGALLQLRFSDNALMTLQAESVFAIDAYQPGDSRTGGQALMRLVEGGFRTITGHIGKGQADAYRVESKAASIGIRGTHYEAVETGEALIVGVYAGGVTVENPQGQIALGRDTAFSFSRVTPGQAPQGLREAPAELGITRSDNTPPSEETEDSDDQAESGDPDSAESDAGSEDTSDTGRPSEAGGSAPASSSRDTTTAAVDAVAPPPPPSQDTGSTVLTTPTATSVTVDPVVTIDYTETNEALNNLLETITDPVVDTRPAPEDGRLTIDEYTQLQQAPLIGAVTDKGPPIYSLATLIAPAAPQPFDFTADTARFTLGWSDVDNGTPIPVEVTLATNITDLDALVADINDDLVAANSPVLARQSQTALGQLEFYTLPNNPAVRFTLYGFQGDTTNVPPDQIQATLGGLSDGAFAHGDLQRGEPMLLWVVQSNGERVFLGNNDIDEATTGTTTGGGSSGSGSANPSDEPEFIDIVLTDPNSYEVARRGEALESEVTTSIGGRSNVTWGIWNASATQPIHLYKDPANPQSFSTTPGSVYWITAEAAELSSLVGSATFTTTGDVLGSGSGGPITGIAGRFDVNFGTGTVSNGQLDLNTPNESWQAQFVGQYQNAQAIMKVYDGALIGSAATSCTSCVSGSLSGVFVKPGDAFAGGFNLYRSDNPAAYVQGVMLMERQ